MFQGKKRTEGLITPMFKYEQKGQLNLTSAASATTTTRTTILHEHVWLVGSSGSVVWWHQGHSRVDRSTAENPLGNQAKQFDLLGNY